MNRLFAFALPFFLLLIFAPLPASARWNPCASETAKEQGIDDRKISETVARFKNSDPGIKKFFKKAYGYAIFPTVGKVGFGIGGAHGKGKVYKKGKYVGRTKLTQLTIGFQLGGQAYSEIIFFKDARALEDFQSGNFELGAQASAVALTAGASLDAAYDNGVAIFTVVKGGLMYEASVGGQKFSYKPKPKKK
ncbi:MAG: lipid-binding SYLF domain-containing protein [Thermodesulfobacteriota bacterium]